VQGAFNDWQQLSTPLLRRRLWLHTVFRLPIAGVAVGLRLLVSRSNRQPENGLGGIFRLP
jgi:hypothetical protein